jgi:hypothetical protein
LIGLIGVLTRLSLAQKDGCITSERELIFFGSEVYTTVQFSDCNNDGRFLYRSFISIENPFRKDFRMYNDPYGELVVHTGYDFHREKSTKEGQGYTFESAFVVSFEAEPILFVVYSTIVTSEGFKEFIVDSSYSTGIITRGTKVYHDLTYLVPNFLRGQSVRVIEGSCKSTGKSLYQTLSGYALNERNGLSYYSRYREIGKAIDARFTTSYGPIIKKDGVAISSNGLDFIARIDQGYNWIIFKRNNSDSYERWILGDSQGEVVKVDTIFPAQFCGIEVQLNQDFNCDGIIGCGACTDGPTSFVYQQIDAPVSCELAPDYELCTGLNSPFQWYRDGQPISGATASSFVPSKADIGRSISLRFMGPKNQTRFTSCYQMINLPSDLAGRNSTTVRREMRPDRNGGSTCWLCVEGEDSCKTSLSRYRVVPKVECCSNCEGNCKEVYGVAREDMTEVFCDADIGPQSLTVNRVIYGFAGNQGIASCYPHPFPFNMWVEYCNGYIMELLILPTLLSLMIIPSLSLLKVQCLMSSLLKTYRL